MSQNLCLEIREREHEEVLSTNQAWSGATKTCNFLSSFLKGNLDMIGLFQAFFDQIVWHAIGIQRHPASVQVKLAYILHLNWIRHGHNLGLSWLVSRVDLNPVSTRSCWDITSAKDYYNSDKCSSR